MRVLMSSPGKYFKVRFYPAFHHSDYFESSEIEGYIEIDNLDTTDKPLTSFRELVFDEMRNLELENKRAKELIKYLVLFSENMEMTDEELDYVKNLFYSLGLDNFYKTYFDFKGVKK